MEQHPEQDQRLVDEQDLRKWYSQIVHMADDELDLHEYRLYGHYKRVCGQNKGVCDETERTTYTHCGIGREKFRDVRASLAKKGYIRIVEEGTPNLPGHKGKPTVIACNDLWVENFVRYAQPEQIAQIQGLIDRKKGTGESPSKPEGTDQSRNETPESRKGTDESPKGTPQMRKKKGEGEEEKKQSIATSVPDVALPSAGADAENGSEPTNRTGVDGATGAEGNEHPPTQTLEQVKAEIAALPRPLGTKNPYDKESQPVTWQLYYDAWQAQEYGKASEARETIQREKTSDALEQDAIAWFVRVMRVKLGNIGVKMTTFGEKKTHLAAFLAPISYMESQNGRMIEVKRGTIAELYHREPLFAEWAEQLALDLSTPIRNKGQKPRTDAVIGWIKREIRQFDSYKATRAKAEAQKAETSAARAVLPNQAEYEANAARFGL